MVVALNILAIQEEQVILQDESGAEIIWPKNKLPQELTVGATLFFNIHPQRDLITNNQKLAQEILHELLKTQDKV